MGIKHDDTFPRSQREGMDSLGSLPAPQAHFRNTTFRNDTERQLWLDIYKAARVENFEPWAPTVPTDHPSPPEPVPSKAARAADFAVAELREREPDMAGLLPVDPRTGETIAWRRGEPR